MQKTVQAKVTQRFGALPERVFDAWIDPTQVRVWMALALQEMGITGEIQDLEISPHVGGRFLFSDLRNGFLAKHWGTYLEINRPNRLVFTWIVDASEEANPSKVTIDIAPENDGCVAILSHEMDTKWMEYVSRTEQGWARMLRAIAKCVEPS